MARLDDPFTYETRELGISIPSLIRLNAALRVRQERNMKFLGELLGLMDCDNRL